MQFSIVVPVYNEAANVLPLVQEISRAMVGIRDWELIYVDDGSDDDTPAALRAASALCPPLRVLRHRRRSGQSSALLNGVRAAFAPWVITLDGDGQNDPRDIPELLERLAGDFTARPVMFAGHRTARQDNCLRRWSSRIANTVRGRLLRDGTPDTGCGLKLFPRELFLALPAFDHMHRFLPALMLRQGARVESVPVRHRPRQRGQSKYGVRNRLWVGLVDLAGVMWLQRRRLDDAMRRDGVLTQLADRFGVYWLGRRTCSAVPEEES